MSFDAAAKVGLIASPGVRIELTAEHALVAQLLRAVPDIRLQPKILTGAASLNASQASRGGGEQ